MNGKTTEIRTRNETALLQSQVDRLTVKNATLSSENRRLRRMTQNGKTGRLLHRTAADARQLVEWRFAYYSISRRNAATYGMSARRWAWGVAMLRLAKIIDNSPTADTDSFQVDDFDECIKAIDRMAAVLAEQENGIERLILRMHTWRKPRR
jgi:hypothetical protein